MSGYLKIPVIDKTAVGLGNVDNTSDASKPISTATQTALDLKLNISGPIGLPSGVRLLKGNRVDFFKSKDGLYTQAYDSSTQTNTAGAFNGTGTGQKSYIGFNNYNLLPFSSFTNFSFEAKYVDDGGGFNGYVAVNILANFNSGALTAAQDYVNIVLDYLPNVYAYIYPLTTSFATYTTSTSDRAYKCVSGTGTITSTVTTTSGSPILTAVSNPAALTVGMYFKKAPVAFPDVLNPIPDGTTIIAIDVGASTVTLSANATLSQAGVSFRQYGGIAPVSRTSATTSGSAVIASIANTTDLQVNMLVSGTGIPANSYIVSMVANTSITINQVTTATGTPTLSFVAAGRTGIPANTEYVGVPWTTIVANNPNGFLANTAPITPTWTTADGGFLKNLIHPSINICQGSTGTSSNQNRLTVFKTVTINSDVYKFAE